MKSKATIAALSALLLAGCGGEDTAQADNAGTNDTPRATYGSSPAKTQPSEQPAPAKSGSGGKGAEKAAEAVGSRTLEYPEDLQMVMLSYRLRGQVPPFENWAKEAQSLRITNEFNRAAVLKEEMDRLQDAYDSTEDVGFIRMRTRSNFTEYDGNRGGYYLTTFSPGTSYQFRAYQDKVALQLVNASAAHFWPMDVQRAQEVLQRNRNNRHVTVDTTIAIMGVERRSSGPVLKGELLDYTIISTGYNSETVLDEISLK